MTVRDYIRLIAARIAEQIDREMTAPPVPREQIEAWTAMKIFGKIDCIYITGSDAGLVEIGPLHEPGVPDRLDYIDQQIKEAAERGDMDEVDRLLDRRNEAGTR